MNEKLGGEFKSEETEDFLFPLFVFIFFAVAILDILLPIRFWLTMLYWLIGYKFLEGLFCRSLLEN